MAHTCLSGSTNTGFNPPSTHFLTQAAPVPACFAPHMESEIHPVLVIEPAACATATAMANIATNRKMLLFMETLRERIFAGSNDALVDGILQVRFSDPSRPSGNTYFDLRALR